MVKKKVVRTPWTVWLPDGTEVVTADGVWYERADGQRLFPIGVDREYDRSLKFKLFPSEVESVG